jgi:hypothetical protein
MRWCLFWKCKAKSNLKLIFRQPDVINANLWYIFQVLWHIYIVINQHISCSDHSKQTSGLSFIVLFTSWSLLADWFLLYCKLAGGFFLFLHHFLGAESHGALCVFQTKLVVSFLTFPKFLAIPMRGVVIIWISLLSASARLLVFHQ